MNLKKGFTLIELLVVIAVIGILSGIVLTFMNSARLKARDARIISNVKNSKTILELGYINSTYRDLRSVAGVTGPNLTGYLFAGTNKDCVGINSAETCRSLKALADDSIKNGGKIYYIINSSDNSYFRASDFALYGRLASNKDIYFCLDSRGGSNPKAKAVSEAICPEAGF